MRRSAMTALALAVLLGSVAAFTWTERLKLDRPPVGGVRFDRWLSPGCGCPTGTVRLSFELREPERIDVLVVDDDGRIVRAAARGLRRPTGRVTLTWDGRDDAGRAVPDGDYRVRIRLRDERRRIVVPEDIHVDSRPPEVELLAAAPSGPLPGEAVTVRYRSDERGTPILLVDGREVLRGRQRGAGERRLEWAGLVAGRPPPSGPHALAVAVEDRAGNVSAPAGGVTISVAGEQPRP